MKRSQPPRRTSPLRRVTSALKRLVRPQPVNRKRRARAFTRAYGSEARVAWIKAQPCIVPLCCRTPCDNAHIVGGGVSRKANANRIVPLCSGLDGHHMLLHTIGRESFEALYHISLDVHARLTDARWQAYAQANGRTTETGEVA